MENDEIYSIYAVETKVKPRNGKNGELSYHSFLIVAQESDEGLKPMQELHFVHSDRPVSNGEGEEFLNTVPCLHGITKPANRNYSEMTFEKFSEGEKEDIFAQWNKMTEIAGSLSALKINFTQNAGRDAVNCRTGTKAVLKALGFDFKPLIDGVESGLNVCVLNGVKDIIVDATPRSFCSAELATRFHSFELPAL